MHKNWVFYLQQGNLLGKTPGHWNRNGNRYLHIRRHSQQIKYLRQIRFTNLPQQCVISIYTISGEKVISLNHSDIDNGSKFWNLRSINNQEVAPGLYIYVVEDTNPNNERNKFIGKFAIVR